MESKRVPKVVQLPDMLLYMYNKVILFINSIVKGHNDVVYPINSRLQLATRRDTTSCTVDLHLSNTLNTRTKFCTGHCYHLVSCSLKPVGQLCICDTTQVQLLFDKRKWATNSMLGWQFWQIGHEMASDQLLFLYSDLWQTQENVNLIFPRESPHGVKVHIIWCECEQQEKNMY